MRLYRTAALMFVLSPLATTVLAQGGAIEGTIRYAGTAPEVRTIAVTKNQEFCGQTLLSRQLVVNDGNVQYAVVHVDGAKGKATTGRVALTNSKCSFDPPVLVASAKSIIEIGNQDPILHNTHLRMRRRTLANLALPHQGDKIENSRILRRAGLVDVECDTHGWMTAKIFVFDHPFYDITDEAGTFHITDVPPGTYTLKLWHEVLGELEQSVTVKSDATTSVDFLLPAMATDQNKGNQ